MLCVLFGLGRLLVFFCRGDAPEALIRASSFESCGLFARQDKEG